jgi:hypothetical protein
MKLVRQLRRLASGRRNDLHGLARHPNFSLVFDEAWYLAKFPDVLNAGLGGPEHFLRSGVHEWRAPSPLIDLRFVAEALPQPRRTGENALKFLLERGIDTGAPVSPFIDLDWLARVNDANDAAPRWRLERLVAARGSAEFSPSPWIDLRWYSDGHPEMHLGGLDPFEYFLSVGRWLQRFPHPAWDEARYLGLNDYVRGAIGSGKFSSGFEHFCAAGWSEVAREATAFPVMIADHEDEYSESRYLAANDDVRSMVEAGGFASGLEHFMLLGHREIAAGRRVLKEASPLASASSRSTGLNRIGDTLVLLNHFDTHGLLDPHVRTAISAYRSDGADVVLVSTSPDIGSAADGLVQVVHKSRNDDLRDFGGWYHALNAIGTDVLSGYRRVVLTNDSVYFPVRDPGPFFARVRRSSADIFAATDSVSGGRYHLQSYFLALGPRAVTLLLPELERRVRAQAEATKLTLIQRFEVGLSEYLIRAGLSSEVFFPLSAIADLAALLHPPDHRQLSRMTATVLNTTHHFWRAALASELPFLKVELLRDNPVGISIDGWQEEILGRCTAAEIEAHLVRMRS